MTDQWVVVTGATGGIGSAVCAALAERGVRPIVGYHRQAEAAAALAARTGGEAVQLDLSAPEGLAAAISALGDREVIGAVLNAALPPDTVAWIDATPEMYARQWSVGVLGNQALLAALYSHCFRPHRRGAIVAVLTQALGEGGRPTPRMAPYIVAKAGLQALLRTLGAEARWLSIDTVSPGYTDTAMLQAFEPRMVEILRDQGQIAAPATVAAGIVERLLGSADG